MRDARTEDSARGNRIRDGAFTGSGRVDLWPAGDPVTIVDFRIYLR
ncbi:MAG: hypothetical protein ABSC23_15735 [Bryobacteraceae bacterium]